MPTNTTTTAKNAPVDLTKLGIDGAGDVTNTPTDKPEFKLENVKLRGAQKTIEVALSDLVSMAKIPVPAAKYAMRDVDEAHVEKMVITLEAGGELPAMDGVGTSWGIVPYDGNHRWAAYEAFVKMHTAPDKLEEARKTLKVPVTIHNNVSNRELIRLTFAANLKHGRGADDTHRSKYAVWLMLQAQLNNEKLSMRQAALLADVDHGAVSKYIKRLEAKANPPVEVPKLDASEKQEIENLKTKEAEQKEEREEKAIPTAMKNLVKVTKTIVAWEDDIDTLVEKMLEDAGTHTNDVNELQVMSQVLVKLAAKLEEKRVKDEEEAAKKRKEHEAAMEEIAASKKKPTPKKDSIDTDLELMDEEEAELAAMSVEDEEEYDEDEEVVNEMMNRGTDGQPED